MIKKLASFDLRKYLFASRFVADKSEIREALQHVAIIPNPKGDGVFIAGSNAKSMCVFIDRTGHADRTYLMQPGRNTDWGMRMNEKLGTRISMEGEFKKDKIKKISLYPSHAQDEPREYPLAMLDLKYPLVMDLLAKRTVKADLEDGLKFGLPADIFDLFNVPPILSPVEDAKRDRRIHLQFFTKTGAANNDPIVVLSPTDPSMIGLVMPSRYDKVNTSKLMPLDAGLAFKALAVADERTKKVKKTKKGKKAK